jgi:hypothetical protein
VREQIASDLVSGKPMPPYEMTCRRAAGPPCSIPDGCLCSSMRLIGSLEMRAETPAPLWTAASLDRCLLLALIYPTVTIFIIWTISGHVGPAELALHLNPHLGVLRRLLPTAVIGLCLFAIWGAVRTKGRKRFGYTLACIAGFVLAIVLSVAGGTPAGTMDPIASAPLPPRSLSG